jgi:hypothetical protein
MLHRRSLTGGAVSPACKPKDSACGKKSRVLKVISVVALLIGGPDAAGAKRAMAAMMPMKKLDIAALEQAYHAISL